MRKLRALWEVYLSCSCEYFKRVLFIKQHFWCWFTELNSVSILTVFCFFFFSEKNIYIQIYIYAHLYTEYFLFYVSKLQVISSDWKGITSVLLCHTFQNSQFCFNFSLVPEIFCAPVCCVQRHSQEPELSGKRCRSKSELGRGIT